MNAAPSPYVLRVGHDRSDGAWDSFLASVDGASPMQSSAWADVKSTLGWQVRRIVAWHGDDIRGGAQMLLRRFGPLGAIGYVPRGPVLADDDPALMRVLLDTLRVLAREQHIHYLHVQPPDGRPRCAALLDEHGFRPSAAQVAAMATVRLDLAQSTDQLLARMKPKTRYNVRLGLRKGVSVRDGGDTDVSAFYDLLRATSRRNGFPTQSLEYYCSVWRTFGRHGCIRLFIAEHAGRPVSALLALAFGNTVTYWRGGWSGSSGSLHPNEALHWHAIQWAKQQGYRWYDLDGIEISQAEGLANEVSGTPLPRTDTSFKMGFGGDCVLMPGAYEYLPNAVLGWLSAAVHSRAARHIKKGFEAALRGASKR